MSFLVGQANISQSFIICLLYIGPWYAAGRCSLHRRYFRPRRPRSAANCYSGRPARRRRRCGGPATDCCCHHPAPSPRPHKAKRKRRRSSGGDGRRRPWRKNCRHRRRRRLSCLNWRGDDCAVSYWRRRRDSNRREKWRRGFVVWCPSCVLGPEQYRTDVRTNDDKATIGQRNIHWWPRSTICLGTQALKSFRFFPWRQNLHTKWGREGNGIWGRGLVQH